MLSSLGSTHGLTLSVGVLSLAVVMGLRRFAPGIPGSLVAVALGDRRRRATRPRSPRPEHRRPHRERAAVAGPARCLRRRVRLARRRRDRRDARRLRRGARAPPRPTPQREHYEIDANRELLGLGGANLAVGLSSGMVVNGSLSKTAVNGSAGAHTQLSGLIVAVLTVVTLLLLTGLFESLPKATLAAVVIAAVIELVDVAGAQAPVSRLRRPPRRPPRTSRRPDFVAAIAAMAGVLIFDTLPGLFIGIGVSLLLLLYRASRPHVAQLGRVPGTADQWGDLRRHPENVVPDRRRRAPRRERLVLRQRRHRPRTRPRRIPGPPSGGARRRDRPVHRRHRRADAAGAARRAVATRRTPAASPATSLACAMCSSAWTPTHRPSSTRPWRQQWRR